MPFEISVHIFPPNFSDFEDIFEVCPNKFWQNGEKFVKVCLHLGDLPSNSTIFHNFTKEEKFRKIVCLHSSKAMKSPFNLTNFSRYQEFEQNLLGHLVANKHILSLSRSFMIFTNLLRSSKKDKKRAT